MPLLGDGQPFELDGVEVQVQTDKAIEMTPHEKEHFTLLHPCFRGTGA